MECITFKLNYLKLNSNELGATAGIVISQEGHFSILVLQESGIFLKM